MGTDVVLSASLGLIAILCIALALFRTGQGMLFGATAGGLGIVAGLILATFTAWGIAPPIACSLCGMGAAFLSGPVMRFRSILKQVSGDANEEDAIAHRALSGLFVSLLTLLAILGTTTIVLSLIALNFDLGHLDVAGLTLISVIAIVAATALILAIRSAPEKT